MFIVILKQNMLHTGESTHPGQYLLPHIQKFIMSINLIKTHLKLSETSLSFIFILQFASKQFPTFQCLASDELNEFSAI